MPTINALTLPQPKNWQDFEDLVLDALRQQWRSPTLQKNGRPGQKQAGVDIYGPDEIGRRAGIQCKRYASLSMDVVETEVANAEKFKGVLNTLIIATTAEHDAKLQQEVRLLSDKRVVSDKFAVGLLFWDDIVGGLQLNPAVFKAHFPQIQLVTAPSIDRERLLAAVEFGYNAPFLWEYVLLTFGELGEMAQTNPDTVNVVLRIVEQRASQLLPPADASIILESAQAIRRGCYEEVSDSDVDSRRRWDRVQAHAERVAERAKSASSLLPISEGNVLETAITLGRVYNDKLSPTKTVAGDLRRRFRSILPDTSQQAVDAAFESAASLTHGYQWAPRIYTCLDREIRWAAF